MNSPIPLGGIAIKKNLDRVVAIKVQQLIKQSVQFAFSNYPLITDYVKEHSQEMSEAVMKQHIDLYVNNFSIDLGQSGKQAIQRLYDVFLNTVSRKNINSSSQLFLL
jgi:1,4-dihydroxy-6-naphthoate synthase